jgi:hypothetical protein
VQLRIVIFEFVLELVEPAREILVRSQNLPQLLRRRERLRSKPERRVGF